MLPDSSRSATPTMYGSIHDRTVPDFSAIVPHTSTADLPRSFSESHLSQYQTRTAPISVQSQIPMAQKRPAPFLHMTPLPQQHLNTQPDSIDESGYFLHRSISTVSTSSSSSGVDASFRPGDSSGQARPALLRSFVLCKPN